MDRCSDVKPCKKADANRAKLQEQWVLLRAPQQHLATATARRPKQVDTLQELCDTVTVSSKHHSQVQVNSQHSKMETFGQIWWQCPHKILVC